MSAGAKASDVRASSPGKEPVWANLPPSAVRAAEREADVRANSPQREIPAASDRPLPRGQKVIGQVAAQRARLERGGGDNVVARGRLIAGSPATASTADSLGDGHEPSQSSAQRARPETGASPERTSATAALVSDSPSTPVSAATVAASGRQVPPLPVGSVAEQRARSEHDATAAVSVVQISTPRRGQESSAQATTAAGGTPAPAAPRGKSPPNGAAAGRAQQLSLLRGSGLVAAQRSRLGLAARTSQETGILSAAREQIESVEQRLQAQIERVQENSDKIREAALARFDLKLATLEANNPLLDRKHAELAGSIRGISEELQCQIRRIDQTDKRLWEWRHDLEGTLLRRISSVEQQCEQVTSAMRISKTTGEEVLSKQNQRLLRLEEGFEEKASESGVVKMTVAQLHNRILELEEVECHRERRLAIGNGSAQPGGDSPTAALAEMAGLEMEHLTEALEARLADTTRKVVELQSETNELLTRVETQEERCRSLRTLQDARDEQFRGIGDRLEKENWDLRFKDLQTRFRDMDMSRATHAEQLELLQSRLENSMQAHDELGQSLRRLQERSAETPTLPGVQGPDQEILANLELCMSRQDESEEQLGKVSTDLRILRCEQDANTQVASLANTLKDLAPKVTCHENELQRQGATLGWVQQDLNTLKKTVSALDIRK